MDAFDISALSGIQTFTVNALLIVAIFCIAAVFTVWYTCRTQIRFSQIIVGAFGYLIWIFLYSILSSSAAASLSGIGYACFYVFLTAVTIELVRYCITKYVLISRFHLADAAVGYALGFAGLYLLASCAVYYFSCYTTAHSYLSNGAEAFFASLTDEEASSAYELLADLSSRSGFQILLTGVNRVFYLLRNVFLSILVWYGMTDGKQRHWLYLVPLLHVIAILPDGLYSAGLIEDSIVSDLAVCVLSGIPIALGAIQYRKHENATAHYQPEKLRTRRHRGSL